MHTAAHFEFGTIGGEANDDYRSRSMGGFALQGMPGYRLLGKSLLVGLLLELRFFTQLAEKGPVEFGGRSFNLGPAFALEGSKVKFLGGWDIRARHATVTPAASYAGSGWRLLVGYKAYGNLWADVQYSSIHYNSRTQNDIDQGISDNPIKHAVVGFGLSYSF